MMYDMMYIRCDIIVIFYQNTFVGEGRRANWIYCHRTSVTQQIRVPYFLHVIQRNVLWENKDGDKRKGSRSIHKHTCTHCTYRVNSRTTMICTVHCTCVSVSVHEWVYLSKSQCCLRSPVEVEAEAQKRDVCERAYYYYSERTQQCAFSLVRGEWVRMVRVFWSKLKTGYVTSITRIRFVWMFAQDDNWTWREWCHI